MRLRYIVLGYVIMNISIKTDHKLLITITSILLLNGCATNYYVDSSRYEEKPKFERITVHVTNPEHADYELLKRSKIYALTDDASAKNKLTLGASLPPNLQPFSRPSCGLGALATVYSLGIIPTTYSEHGYMSYSLMTNGSTKTHKHDINYYSTTSLWQIPLTPFAHSKLRAQAKALSTSDRKVCDKKSCQ